MKNVLLPTMDKREIDNKTYIFIMLLAFVFWNWALLFANITSTLLNKDMIYPYEIDGNSNLFIWFALVVLIVPIVEEFVLRGAIYGNLRRKINSFVSAIIVAALCAIIYSPFGFSVTLNLVVLSLMYSSIYQRFGRLDLTIVFHGLNNLLFFLLNVEGVHDPFVDVMNAVSPQIVLLFFIELEIIRQLCKRVFMTENKNQGKEALCS